MIAADWFTPVYSTFSAMVQYFEKISYRVISAAFCLLGLVPPKTACRLADTIGHIWFVFDRRHRNVAVDNLNRVFGREMSGAEIRGLARKIFQNLVRILFEIGWAQHLSDRQFWKFFRFKGLHHLGSAVKKGKGVLMLTAHMGNWELMAMAAGRLGYPMSAVYRPFDFKPLDRYFIKLRGAYGAGLYPKANAMRKILRSLKRKEVVGILLDQNTNVDAGVFVDFFGRPACTNKGLALMALGTRAPVIPVFVFRENNGFKVDIGAEIPLMETGDQEADIAMNTRLYNRVLETAIRRHPEQWFWVHRRWKTRPKPSDL